jgi:urease accessory protein
MSRLPAPGTGRLEVARQGARSIVTRAVAASPLRLLTPRNHGTAAWVYAATYGGGLVDGDAVRLDVSVGRDAMAMLSTQASTKVYRSRRGTSMTLDVTVASGGLIAILPDPVVLFAGSTCRQSQRVDLEAGAGLVLVDALSSGRRAAGERWRFDRYASRLEVHQQGRLVLLDALALDADEGDLETRLGRFNILCVIVLLGPAVSSQAQNALARAASCPVVKRADLLIGASPVAGQGCIIRVAGVSLEEVAAAAHEYVGFVPSLLGDDPRARKW